jgi:hypothetical protein
MTTLGAYRGINRDALAWLGAAKPVDPNVVFYRTNLPRAPLDDRADALTTQVMTSVPIWLEAGDLVTNLSAISGATAAGTPTNYWFALYSAAGALLSQSADQLTAAWAADTVKTLPLAVAQRIPFRGVYFAAIMVKATTPPSLVGSLGAKPILTGEGNIAQTSGSALTTTAPATIVTPAFQRAVPLVVAS